ncbi:MAG TPA: Ig-like domain-containing protein, partial [Vicinamibacteria bacterium]|nr:Ig-like domain-containing protein [Vicinamibacteria bacterium]
MRFDRRRLAGLALLATAISLNPASARAQTVSCTGIPAWVATTTYAVGARVTYQGGLYEALQSTTNVQPNYCPACGWWRLLGTCGGGNTPPSVSITAPAPNASFAAGANITISANASDPGGSVTQVQFRQGTTAIGSPDTTAPYSVTWSNVAAGSYSLTAVATDNQGASTTSSAVNITVTAAGCTAAPAVPGGLNSPSQTTTSVNLAWNAVPAVPNCGAAQYRVFR